MSNLDIRPVTLRGTSNFRPFRVPAFAPPSHEAFFNKKRMGEKKLTGSFSSKEIPLSLALGAGSAGAIVWGAGLPPGGWKTLLIGAGLVGLGYSIYNLFSGPEEVKIGPKEPGDFSGLASKEDFDAITAQFLNPKMYEQKMPFSNKTVNLLITNPTPRVVEFTLIVPEYEGTPPAYSGDAYRKPVSVPASGTLPVSFDVVPGSWTPSAIKLVANKLRSAAEQPVKMAEVTYFS